MNRMNIKKRLTLPLLAMLAPLAGWGQSVQAWSLDRCMAYAVEHSPRVKKQQYTNDNYRHDRREAVSALLPSLSASVGANVSTGRGIDPGTNTYSTISNFNNTYGVSASVPVFNGFALINRVKIARTAIRSGQEAMRVITDDICLATMQAYYDAVYYRLAAQIAQQKLEESRQNVRKAQKMLALGLQGEADVAQVEATLAADDYNLAQQQDNYTLAMIALKSAMNFPPDDTLEVDTAVQVSPTALSDTRQIYRQALAINPKILVSDYNLRMRELEYAQTKGRMLPSISLSGGYSTNYFTTLTGDRSGVVPFGSQFDQNKGGYVSMSLSIPIFSGLSRRSSLNRSRNYMQIARLENLEVRREVHDQIVQAVSQRDGLAKQYELARQQVRSNDLAHRASVRKYEKGLLSPIELRTSANTLMLSRCEELGARLRYLIKCRLVDYYNGRPFLEEKEEEDFSTNNN